MNTFQYILHGHTGNTLELSFLRGLERLWSSNWKINLLDVKLTKTYSYEMQIGYLDCIVGYIISIVCSNGDILTVLRANLVIYITCIEKAC